jgi:hypothetical protein
MADIRPSGADLLVSLEANEADVLRALLDELRDVIEEAEGVDRSVMERLFPKAYADEADAAAFAELVGDELRSQKRAAIETMRAQLGAQGPTEVTVTSSDKDTWLPVINDLRLAIGTKLDVDEDKMGRPLDPTDPEAPALSVMHWLGWMQESLLNPSINEEQT